MDCTLPIKKTRDPRAGKMAQRLRAHSTHCFAEDQSWVPRARGRWLTTAGNSSSRRLDVTEALTPSSGCWKHYTHVHITIHRHTEICVDNLKNNNLKRKVPLFYLIYRETSALRRASWLFSLSTLFVLTCQCTYIYQAHTVGADSLKLSDPFLQERPT